MTKDIYSGADVSRIINKFIEENNITPENFHTHIKEAVEHMKIESDCITEYNMFVFGMIYAIEVNHMSRDVE